MRTTRRVAAGFAAALLSSGLAILSPVLTSSADAAELLVDGGFEAATGSPPVSPGWTVSDSVFDTPVCSAEECSAAPAGVGARTGTGFVWFGRTTTAGHTSKISQVLTIPAGSATLGYWFANPQVSDSGAPATLNVTIDGKRVQTIFELQFAETYAQLRLDISEFADGGSHVLAFEYLNGETGDNSMTLDDISIDAVAGAPPVNANAGTLGAIPPGIGCDLVTYGPPRDVTFTVTGKVGKPTSVGVRIAFDPAHTYAGDVLAVLIAPDGRRAQIFGGMNDPFDSGGSDDDNDLVGPYLFSDAAQEGPSIEDASQDSGDEVVPPGHYRALATSNQMITPAFADLGDANGTWTLRVRDLCETDTGTVSAAALYLGTDGVAVDTDGDGVPDGTDDCPTKAGAKPNGCPDTTAPDTDFLSSPADGIARSLKVPFGFVSDETGVSYLCSLDDAAYTTCPNPTILTVAPGSHTLRVAARDPSGNVDPYPATSAFTALRLPQPQRRRRPPDQGAQGRQEGHQEDQDPARAGHRGRRPGQGQEAEDQAHEAREEEDHHGQEARQGQEARRPLPGGGIERPSGMILTTRRNHMLTTRRVAAGFAAALLSSGLAILSPVLTSSADAAELLVDGGFEAATGSPPVSPGWTVSDSVFDTPICSGAWCSAAPPGVGARTGTGFVWFGGTDTAGHTSKISQVLTIPAGSATLRYWFANPQVSDSGAPALVNVTIDGKRVQTIFEPQFAETYAQLRLDISEFADGGSHVLAFEYLNGETGDNSMTLDDISIDAVAEAPPVNANAGTLGAIPDALVCDEFSPGPPRDVTFTVTGKVGKPTSVGVRIAFDPAHTHAGDVLAVLIAPDGRRNTIVGQLDDFNDSNDLVGPYLFSDAAPGGPSFEDASRNSGDGSVPPGHYRASTHGNDLITPAFADLGDANGTWTLRVRDLCETDTGSVSAAALYVTTSGVPTDTDGDGVPDGTDDCPTKAGAEAQRLPGHHRTRHRLPEQPGRRDRQVAEGALRVRLRRDRRQLPLLAGRRGVHDLPEPDDPDGRCGKPHPPRGRPRPLGQRRSLPGNDRVHRATTATASTPTSPT